MRSDFDENAILSHVNDSENQIHNIQFYFAEVYPVLQHWWGV